VRDDSIYLPYIAESIERIEQYLPDADPNANRSRFQEDPLVQDAVLRRMETLADAAGHLSDGLKGRHPEIPWRQVTDFRNQVAHGYLDIDIDRAWSAGADLPRLKAIVQDELERLRG
jgi:uncharacterized protein with HEPN domain